MVQITNVAPVLLVADVFATAEYYRDVLGFHFDQIYGDPPSFVVVERDGVQLMFRQPGEGAPPPPNASVTPHFPGDMFLRVDDVAPQVFLQPGVEPVRAIEYEAEHRVPPARD